MVQDWPNLPAQLRLARGGTRLTLRNSHPRIHLPVVRLSRATAGTVRSVIASREPSVILAPHVTRLARELITDAAWGWVDAQGNAHIEAPGVLVHIERPPAHGRVEELLRIPPQGERVVRYLLDHYPDAPRWSDLSVETQLDRGYTSRIVRKLVEAGLVSKRPRGPIVVEYPAELFEAWRASTRPVTEMGWFVDLPPRKLADRLMDARKNQCAITGVFAAGLLTGFQDSERVEAFVSDRAAGRRLASTLGGVIAERGPNLQLLVHRDPGIVRIGASRTRGLTFVSHAQIYLDAVVRGRGRDLDTAARFRREFLKW